METVVKIADGSTVALAVLYAVLAAIYGIARNSKWQYWAGAAVLTFWVAKQ